VAATGGERPHFEVADIVHLHGEAYRRTHDPSGAQQAVLRHIAECRTSALGGHVDECDACGHQRISYNSCRDRHCPKCQGRARAAWLASRLERLLPVPYFHVVFTLPEQLNALALGNKRRLFTILFAAAADTLKTLARDPRHLGAEPGFLAVLHTWGQNLLFHPHLHCVLTGGGLSADGRRWVRARQRFLLPVRVLGRLFRGKFLAALNQARAQGRLHFGGSTTPLSDEIAWKLLLDELYRKNWIVYAKPPFGGPDHVFRYLGRYTHRVAISNHRIVDHHNGRVSFSLKDYADGGRRKIMTVSAVEFLRRFLLHVLPQGFTRIRHFGLCAGGSVHGKLETARRLLAAEERLRAPAVPIPHHDAPVERAAPDPLSCPRCEHGRLVRRRLLAPDPVSTGAPHAKTVIPDTS